MNYIQLNTRMSTNVSFKNISIESKDDVVFDTYTQDELNDNFKRASKDGDLEKVKYLVSVGADIHADNDYSIRIASERGHLEVIKFLVSVGADINSYNEYCVSWASYNGHLDVVKFLTSVGANIHSYDDESIRWASRNGHLDVVKFLVSIGADIHIDNDYSIRYASENRHLEVVKFLVSVGADIKYISKQMKIEIFGSKIRDFYRRQRDRKKIVSINRQLTPLYYDPCNKGGYFAKKDLSNFFTDTF